MNATERLLGVETEYAVSWGEQCAEEQARKDLLRRFMAHAQQRLPHLPANQSGIFLESGAKLYIDYGLHPEFCTPECSSPAEAVSNILAGEKLLADLVDEMQCEDETLSGFYLYRCNVDYYSGATWGCHENYLHRSDPSVVAHAIVPHLVSRVIYTGAGGFNSLSPGLEFLLSPRAPHLKFVFSPESIKDRGIFHSKNEPLAMNGYGRLHIIAGESLCSQTAMFLKLGTTALIVALVDAGLAPGNDMSLCNPVSSMQAFARDQTLKKSVQLSSGKSLTAIEIQRHYLEAVESQLGMPFMPSWAEQACRCWRSVLDKLQTGLEPLSTVLDWPMKLTLFKQHAARRGFAWESIPVWSAVVSRIAKSLMAQEVPPESVSMRSVAGGDASVQQVVHVVKRRLDQAQLRWEDLDRFLDLSAELLEVDTMFGCLGRDCIFTQLDRSGLLDHRIPGVDGIAEATRRPPLIGRAHIRGDWVRRLSRRSPGSCRCDWDFIEDFESGQVLDLGDPFQTNGVWKPIQRQETPPPIPEPPQPVVRTSDSINDMLSYLRGRIRRR